MRIAVALVASCLLVLVGCQRESDPDPEPSPTPSQSVPALSNSDVAGAWVAELETSIIIFNLNADGTYVLDVDEAQHISSGPFSLEGHTITFEDGEAAGQVGVFDGDVLTIDGVEYVKEQPH